MKKIFLIFLATSLISSSFGQMNKVALVSFYANKQIDASDFTGIGVAIQMLAKDSNFNLQPIIEKFKGKLYSELASEMPFEFVPDEKIINNDRYKSLSANFNPPLGKFYYTSPKGYDFLPNSKKYLDSLFWAFEDENIDGLMFIDVNYKLNKQFEAMGFGTAKVIATVLITIYNKKKKRVFYMPVFQPSDNKLKFALGGSALEAEKILPLCEETTDKCYMRMKEKLPRKLAKMKKKMAK